MQTILNDLLETLEQESNPTKAIEMAAYMKNHFAFYGIPTPQRRVISKAFFKLYTPQTTQEIIETATFLWHQPKRECHYIAIELLECHKKKFDENSIKLYEKFTITNSWWDSVDSICSNLLDYYFKKFPHQLIPVTRKWNNQKNIWLQRNSIMCQKFFKTKTNTEMLSTYILNCASSKEFFIQKAIGWALREYAKTNPTWVLNFSQQYKNQLSPLSYKEAIRNIS